MYNQLCEIENKLCACVPLEFRRCCSRCFDGGSIILTFNGNHNLSIILKCDIIQINYLGESEIFDITTYERLHSSLSVISHFINELMSGALLCERVYCGHTQIKQSVSLVNAHSRRSIKSVNAVSCAHTSHEPRLVMVEKIVFF